MNKIGEVKFSEIFSPEYLDMMIKYKFRVQELLKIYDVVVFMARKSICFYKAMVSNGEITSTDKVIVLSSRSLTYNIIDNFKGKKIAIIDDVVVKGRSLEKAIREFEKLGVDVDVHFVACEKEVFNSLIFKDKIKSSFVFLPETDIYQLSSYITEYIAASMIPYNVDQPIYTITLQSISEFKNEFINRNSISDITDGLQKRYGIQNITIHFNTTVLKEILGTNFDLDNTYLKIRFLYETHSLNITAIPFVLLPELSYQELDELYYKIFGNLIDKYIIRHLEREAYENKLKVVQYILSDMLFTNYLKESRFLIAEKDIENEHEQFSDILGSYLDGNNSADGSTSMTINNQMMGYSSHFEFDYYLSRAYDYIFDPLDQNLYLNAEGEKQDQSIITFAGLLAFFHDGEQKVEKAIVSSIIDILVDKGILIPSIAHRENNILRGYKRGEIFNLTRKGISLFAYMLDRYADLKEGVPLDKIELEKLCVLFFKNAAYKHKLFSSSKSFEEDCYSICYSKFGPRVSNCNQKYSVSSDSALALSLKEDGKININADNKYEVEIESAPTNSKWKIIAENFALTYFYLYKCFKNNVDIKNMFVHTCNDFLTLLAIGPNKKNRMYSLMAELYLIKRINMDSTLNVIIDAMDKYSTKKGNYQGIMDGIGSGMWKYMCYCKDNLIEDVFIETSKKERDIRYIKEDYLSSLDETDENPIFDELIDRCGNLLYEIAYLFNYSQIRINANYDSKYVNNKFGKGAFYNERFKSMRHAIKWRCENGTDEEIISDFKILKKRAEALLNECDLIIEDTTLSSIENYRNLWILYSPEVRLNTYGNEITIRTNAENDILQKCVLVQYSTNQSFEEQFSRIMDQYGIFNKETLLVLTYMEDPYEGIFVSNRSATGTFFKRLVDCIIKRNNNDRTNKIIICKKKLYKEDIHLDDYILQMDCYGEIFDGYYFIQYIIIMKRGINPMKENKQERANQTFNFYNSTVGAIGDDNHVEQEINGEVSMDLIYKAIEDIDTEMLGGDKSATKLVENLKEDAKEKNKQGVINKLKELAKSVGSSVFTKLVSSIIIDFMKANGWLLI